MALTLLYLPFLIAASSPVVSVLVPGVLDAQVIQQPAYSPGYVSRIPGVITQLYPAAQFGVIGLLAHNGDVGREFYNLYPGMVVTIAKGDMTTRNYTVIQVDEWQVVPDGLMDADGSILSESSVFVKYYTGGDHVTFQTCIDRNGISAWGRLFVVAR